EHDFSPTEVTGKHLPPEELHTWLAEGKNFEIVDMRNDYEHALGHFKGSILPPLENFRDLPKVLSTLEPLKEKTVLTVCTGGVRCEKASAWFKHRGFKNVHQLEGGIIKYANDCKEKGLENKFIGKNFVFDERRGERITPDIISICHQCGAPADTHTNCLNEACHLLFIQCESCKATMENCCSTTCQETIHLPLETQKEMRKGQNKSNLIFKKGRSTALPFQGHKEKPQALVDQALQNSNQ
ncbi:MAG: rhodanese-related sulfurtransferase, partial [Sphingomonadales bacterium]